MFPHFAGNRAEKSYVVLRIPAAVPSVYDLADVMTGCVVLRGKSAMQLYARNIMALTAASAVLAAGVVTMPPATADIAAPRIVTTDVALVANAACIRTGTCDIGKNLSLLIDGLLNLAPGPAYVVTQAAYLASDVVAVAAAGVAYGATLATAQIVFVLQKLQMSAAVPECGGSFCGDVGSAPTVALARQRLDDAVGQLRTDWANTFSADHFNAYVEGLAGIVIPIVPYLGPPNPVIVRSDAEPPVPEVASVRSRLVAGVPARARAASVTPRQSPSAKAAAASVETAPTAEQGQRRATRGAAHRAERSGTGVESP